MFATAIRALSWLVVLGLATACASHHYTVLEPAKRSLADFDVLQIQDFTSNLIDDESKALAARFADKLLGDLQQRRDGSKRERRSRVTPARVAACSY
jgi:hypothetical protein